MPGTCFVPVMFVLDGISSYNAFGLVLLFDLKLKPSTSVDDCEGLFIFSFFLNITFTLYLFLAGVPAKRSNTPPCGILVP